MLKATCCSPTPATDSSLPGTPGAWPGNNGSDDNRAIKVELSFLRFLALQIWPPTFRPPSLPLAANFALNSKAKQVKKLPQYRLDRCRLHHHDHRGHDHQLAATWAALSSLVALGGRRSYKMDLAGWLDAIRSAFHRRQGQSKHLLAALL